MEIYSPSPDEMATQEAQFVASIYKDLAGEPPTEKRSDAALFLDYNADELTRLRRHRRQLTHLRWLGSSFNL